MMRFNGSSSRSACQAIVAYHVLEIALYLYFICMELLVTETKLERSLRFDSRVALLACLMMGAPVTIKCFFCLSSDRWDLVRPYQTYMAVTPVILAVYSADLHLVSCASGRAGNIHGFSVFHLALALALHGISLIYMNQTAHQACKEIKSPKRTTDIIEQIPTSTFARDPWRARSPSSAAECGSTRSPSPASPPLSPVRKADTATTTTTTNDKQAARAHGRGVLRLARGCETYEGTIRKFNAARGFGFVTMESSGVDIYFKTTTCSHEIQAMGEQMAGTPVEFILRWMPDGVPQVRAMLQRKPKFHFQQKEKAPAPPLDGDS